MGVKTEWKCICGQHGLFTGLGGGLIECPQCLRRYIVTAKGYLVRIFNQGARRG